jgi:NAD(P)-dependent dehydrogenase (short-subunit alcohol dehydrogenase family)
MAVNTADKAVLITGVSSGIGQELARYLCGKGYRVFGSVRSADAATELGKQLGERFHGLVFDVTDRTALDAARRRVEKALEGRSLAALVNNAGLALFGPLQLIDDDEFERLMQVNLFGVRNTINTFLPLLGRGSDAGKIINMSSLSGIFNTPMNGAYCVSKHALESLGEIYRREFYQYGIDVVSIRPGPIQSRIWEKNIGAAERYRATDYAPMASNAERVMLAAQRNAMPPERIANLVLDIIENRKNRPTYMVDTHKWKMLILARLLPPRLVDYMIWRKLGRL